MLTMLEATSTGGYRISGSSSHALLSAWYHIPLLQRISFSARLQLHPVVECMDSVAISRHRPLYALACEVYFDDDKIPAADMLKKENAFDYACSFPVYKKS